MQTASTVLIVGASARAAAFSAIRAGMKPVCVDLFADEDLKAAADVQTVVRYPQDLPQLAEQIPICPWMYVGALENHPQIVAEISAHRPLWGNPAEVLKAVRNPLQVASVLEKSGFSVPQIRSSEDPPVADGRWLLKPINGSAGRGICAWNRGNLHSRTLSELHYFQQFFSGTSMSALFLAGCSGTELIGITRQLVGEDWLNVPSFAYCGSLGPIDLPTGIQRELERMGTVISREFHLRGLFGLDFLLDGEVARLTEINPRYTASVEILETAYDLPLLRRHALACEEHEKTDAVSESSPTFEEKPLRPEKIFGKAVLYAERDLIVPGLVDLLQTVTGLPLHLADRPAAGTRIRAGHPVCTVFAEGNDENSCLQSLRYNVQRVQDIIHSPERQDTPAQSLERN